MPELELPQRQATDAVMLTGFWYRALPADCVHRNQLQKATLLEIPLVIGRDRWGNRLPCATPARIAACLSTAATSMEKIWNADITAGNSTLTTDNASSFPSLTPIRI